MTSTGILRLSNKYYNSGGGDAAPGSSITVAQGGSQTYPGQVGATELLSYSAAQTVSDPAVTAKVQGGKFQYVNFVASGTAYAPGQVLYWSDETTYVVTNVPPTSLAFAGICLTAVTQGYYWLMQVAGVAQVLFGATVVATAGTAVYSDSSTPSVAVNTTDATIVNGGVTPVSGTSAGLKRYLGITKAAPTASVLNLVYLVNIAQVF